jgi:hypothetical protein
MMVINRLIFLAMLAAAPDSAQQDPLQLAISSNEPVTIKTQDMEILTITALRKEFPRLSGVFASVHSCRLPEYGPFISVTIQLPAYYFTRPVLQELDRRQRAAEAQAKKVRAQLDRASQVISLRSKEAGLMERIEWEESSKKKSKDVIDELQTELGEVRKSLLNLESSQPPTLVVEETTIQLNDVDLNKMLVANYQQLVQRVTKAMKNSLAENAPRIEGVGPEERISINAYIRDNILASPGKSLLFILHEKDIQEFKAGRITPDELRERVIVQDDVRE